jgi:hypothetical protein
MHEQTKLDEAAHFLAAMSATQATPRVFQYNLSAFLSAARSVLQYSLEEARTRPGGQAWYDSSVSQSTTIAFMKDQRDGNIHYQPVQPAKDVTLRVFDGARASDESEVAHFDSNGVLIEREARPPRPPAAVAPLSPHSVEYRYRFASWQGQGGVIDLAKEYLDEIRAMVADGVRRGLLTP